MVKMSTNQRGAASRYPPSSGRVLGSASRDLSQPLTPIHGSSGNNGSMSGPFGWPRMGSVRPITSANAERYPASRTLSTASTEIVLPLVSTQTRDSVTRQSTPSHLPIHSQRASQCRQSIQQRLPSIQIRSGFAATPSTANNPPSTIIDIYDSSANFTVSITNNGDSTQSCVFTNGAGNNSTPTNGNHMIYHR